ncbi:MAG: ABC transporter permease [Faecalicatena sp.]|uniref:ABC transporter permease n=1 Tax=Faecalicatena sp. TaxID=2005360 RepID=UPI00258AF597|nr:ABC transporter permease [Faecalicatena sp.]MCI6466273.1 ABC transporter permease [Faecalicatena sp.]MDY5617715.1 ABC transporter permease [Lachnospiraceae bacterium]
MRNKNLRQRVLIGLIVSAAILLAICVGGLFCAEAAKTSDFTRKNLPPCLTYPFGTDWLGRDMLARTLRGISLSILLGILAAAVSACIALLLGIAAATLGRTADAMITFVIDLLLGIPHILLLILISVALGKGFAGVAWGVALTHWPSLARLIRAEVMQLKESPYIQIARKLGKSNWYVARKHMLPHLLPQFLTGLVLLFPHAILHEASVTFLGFGLSSEQPAIGIILSESMKYLVTGKWWLALFPGAALVMVVVLFYAAGENVRKLTDPASVHE